MCQTATHNSQHVHILSFGTTTPKEGDEHDDGTQDDDTDGGSLIVAIEELDVGAEEPLGHSTQYNEHPTGQLKKWREENGMNVHDGKISYIYIA